MDILLYTEVFSSKPLPSENQSPAIYRTQIDPKERFYMGDGGTLFENWVQRKALNRFILKNKPDKHSGLGLDLYVTATSPIRRYFDLITQRQIRAILGLENFYTADEIEKKIQVLEHPMRIASQIQIRRNRYWLLKYLEKRIGQKEEALVIQKRRGLYNVLLTEYMIEYYLPLPSSIILNPEDIIQVTIQNANARNDILSLQIS